MAAASAGVMLAIVAKSSPSWREIEMKENQPRRRSYNENNIFSGGENAMKISGWRKYRRNRSKASESSYWRRKLSGENINES
jgi:hypothetical protein